jgi:hypothetical protein
MVRILAALVLLISNTMAWSATPQKGEFTMEFTFVDGSHSDAPVAGATVKVKGTDIDLKLTTDAAGKTLIALPVKRPAYLTIRASKDGYVPRRVDWDLDQPDFNLPERYTLKTEKGRRIGGVVKNAEGKPVADAKVVLIIRGSSMGGRSEQVFNDIWEKRVETDTKGHWHYDEAPSDLRLLSVTVVHPDYVSYERIASRPQPDDFLKENATLIVRHGVPCEGVVTDEAGKPVAGAEVIYGEGGSDSCTVPSVKTDEKGNFRFGALSLERRMQGPILTVFAKGYAPEMIELPAAAPREGALKFPVALKSGGTVKLRVVDRKGKPLEGVSLCPDYWRKHQPFNSRFQSDKDGLIVWEHAPQDAVTCDIIGKDIQRKTVIVKPQSAMQTLTLLRPTVAHGRVIDAQTRQPILNYKLIAGTYFAQHDPGWSDWARGSARVFTTDSYTHLFDEPAHINSTSGEELPTEGAHRLRVEAEGYAPAVSRPIANSEENVEINFELKREEAIRGVVKSAEGKPVVNAEIIVGGLGNAARVTNGVCSYRAEHLIVKTNDKGEYSLGPQESDFPVAVVHPESGYRLTSVKELRTHPDVSLEPWGQLRVVSTAGTSSKEPPYYVRYAKEEDENMRGVSTSRITFEAEHPQHLPEGALLYRCLVPGEIRVNQFGCALNNPRTVAIESGKTAVLDFGSGRRAIVGQLRILPGFPTQLPGANLTLRTALPEPKLDADLSQEEMLKHHQAWFKSWSQTPEGKALLAKSVTIDFNIDPAGHFRIDDVPLGKYRLVAFFTNRNISGAGGAHEPLGAGAKEFELPAGKGDFDLGTISVQRIEDLQKQTAPAP